MSSKPFVLAESPVEFNYNKGKSDNLTSAELFWARLKEEVDKEYTWSNFLRSSAGVFLHAFSLTYYWLYC